MSAAPNLPSTRMDFRLSAEHKSLIERAASVDGQTVSNFAISSLVKAAEEAIRRATNRALSARDSQAFLEMLESNAEPNAALKAAARRYKDRRVR